MYLRKLNLVNFRNYEKLEIKFNSKKTLIVGDNAQGKTNLVESIYFLATLSSQRTSKDDEFILWEKPKSVVSGVIEKENGAVIDLDVIISRDSPKLVKVNKLRKSAYNEFLGFLSVVSFSVNDLLLLRGSPKDRRRWIDLAIYQLYPAYYNRLQKYNKIKQQKKALLDSFYGHANNLSSMQLDMLESWNSQISVAGSNIIYLRQKFLKEIYPIASTRTQEISGGRDELKIAYESSIDQIVWSHETTPISVEKIKERYDQALNAVMQEEIIKGQILFGPHRDDINFMINDKEAKSFASQGQQRTIVLSLKLSELDLLRQAISEEPILLLDDVLAELDIARQKYLFDTITNSNQTIITTTDIDSFEEGWLKDVEVLTVEKGNISHAKAL